MISFQACETALVTSSDWEKRFNTAIKRNNLLKEEIKDLQKKHKDSEEEIDRQKSESQSLRDELASAKLQISNLQLANSQLSVSQGGVNDLKTEVQKLTRDLAHRTERCSLYKRELDITKENHYAYLEEYRNNLLGEVCLKHGISRLAFPDLDKPTRKIIDSLNIEDSDLEGEFSDGESEAGSDHTGDEETRK